MDRIERLPVATILEMQVIARGSAGTANPADDFAL
jgi:hypothetical protein